MVSSSPLKVENPHDYMTGVAYRLVANMIGDDRATTGEMGAAYEVTPDDLKAFPVARRMLEIILHMENDDREEITAKSVKDFMAAVGDEQWLIDEVDAVMKYQSPDRDVRHIAYTITQIFRQRRINIDLYREIGEIFNSHYGTPKDKRRQVAELIELHAPKDNLEEPLHQTVVAAEWIEDVIERRRRLEEGLEIGPTWPYESLRELVPYLRRGDMNVLMAKSKYGKTTVGGICAEHWAWQQGYRVYVYLSETTPETIYARSVARNCTIPLSYSLGGKWNPMPDKNSENYEQEIRRNQQANTYYQGFLDTRINNSEIGDIIYEKAFAWSYPELKARILQNEEAAKADGVEAVHLFDYFQAFNLEYFEAASNTPENNFAHKLKMIAQNNELFMMVLVQEQEGSEEGMNDRVYPKGGNEILKRAQLVMRLHREKADTLEEVGTDANPARDAFGNRLVWQRPGSWSKELKWQVIRVNDGRSGEVELYFLGDIYDIREDYT